MVTLESKLKKYMVSRFYALYLQLHFCMHFSIRIISSLLLCDHIFESSQGVCISDVKTYAISDTIACSLPLKLCLLFFSCESKRQYVCIFSHRS